VTGNSARAPSPGPVGRFGTRRRGSGPMGADPLPRSRRGTCRSRPGPDPATIPATRPPAGPTRAGASLSPTAWRRVPAAGGGARERFSPGPPRLGYITRIIGGRGRGACAAPPINVRTTTASRGPRTRPLLRSARDANGRANERTKVRGVGHRTDRRPPAGRSSGGRFASAFANIPALGGRHEVSGPKLGHSPPRASLEGRRSDGVHRALHEGRATSPQDGKPFAPTDLDVLENLAQLTAWIDDRRHTIVAAHSRSEFRTLFEIEDVIR
jgi:hypothetical protein